MRANSSITRSRSIVVPFLFLSQFVIGCGTPGVVGGTPSGVVTAQSSAALPERAHIQAVYQSHCGSCHRPVAPGSEPSDRLEAELERHHKRTRLTEAEWAGLDAFLVARP